MAKQRLKPHQIDVCYVYVIGMREGDTVLPYSKIGIAQNIKRRLEGMATSSPFDLFCAYSHACESRKLALDAESVAHKHLDRFRVRGEWFAISPDRCAAEIVAKIGQPSVRAQFVISGLRNAAANDNSAVRDNVAWLRPKIHEK